MRLQCKMHHTTRYGGPFWSVVLPAADYDDFSKMIAYSTRITRFTVYVLIENHITLSRKSMGIIAYFGAGGGIVVGYRQSTKH